MAQQVLIMSCRDMLGTRDIYQYLDGICSCISLMRTVERENGEGDMHVFFWYDCCHFNETSMTVWSLDVKEWDNKAT